MSRPRRTLPDPREWVGSEPFPWPPPTQLRPGERVVACYSVLAVRPATDPTGVATVQLDLGDANGRVSAALAADAPEWLRAGIYIGIRGTSFSVNGQARIQIEELSPLHVALEDLELFLPRTGQDLEQLNIELSAAIDSVRDPALHALLLRLLGANTETGRGFRLAPAATRNHHAYLGGLLEHTVSVVRLCDAMAAHYREEIDRDLLITAALLHDIGKVREIGAQIGFPYTDEGRLLGHILLGMQMIDEAAARVRGLDSKRRLLLQHLIASHQGRYEWQSPREPRILEALILHHVDDLDAKVNHALTLLQGVESGWTEYDRGLGRELLRHANTAVATTIPAVQGSGRAPLAVMPGRALTASGDVPHRDPQAAGPARSRKKARTDRKAKKNARARKKKQSARSARSRPSDQKESRSTGGPTPFVDRDTLDLFA